MVESCNSSNQTSESTTVAGCLLPFATTAEKVAKTSAYIVILVIAMLGNILVVYVICKSKRVQRNVNFLILNMVASDLLIPVFVFPRKIVEIVMELETKWLLTGLAGQISCKMINFMQDLATAVSVQTVVLIALERLVAVVFPLRVSMITLRMRVALIASTWIIGAAVHAPYFYIFKLKETDMGAYCVPSFAPAFIEPQTSKIYGMFLSVFLFLFPFPLLSLIYTIIVRTLMRERKALKHVMRGGIIRDKINRNVLKMALTIVAVFAICWAPFNIYMFILIFVWNWEVPRCHKTSFRFAAIFLAYANTAINPCVYFAFVEHYRRSLRNALSGSILHTSIREAGSRLTVRRETFELTSISCDRLSNTQSKTSGIHVISSKRLRCESEASIAEVAL